MTATDLPYTKPCIDMQGTQAGCTHLIALLVQLVIPNNGLTCSGVNSMDHAMTVACQNEVAVPADIHAIQHLPVALIADSFYPAIWIQIQQLRITAAFNVKALRMQARVVYKQDWNSGCP